MSPTLRAAAANSSTAFPQVPRSMPRLPSALNTDLTKGFLVEASVLG
jgi:hypothetical protein